MERNFISKMFGFMWRQPIHLTLRQMRIVPLGLIISSQMLVWEIVSHMRVLQGEEAAMAYGTIAVTLITAIWKGIDSLHKPNQPDADYDLEEEIARKTKKFERQSYGRHRRKQKEFSDESAGSLEE